MHELSKKQKNGKEKNKEAGQQITRTSEPEKTTTQNIALPYTIRMQTASSSASQVSGMW